MRAKDDLVKYCIIPTGGGETSYLTLYVSEPIIDLLEAALFSLYWRGSSVKLASNSNENTNRKESTKTAWKLSLTVPSSQLGTFSRKAKAFDDVCETEKLSKKTTVAVSLLELR